MDGAGRLARSDRSLRPQVNLGAAAYGALTKDLEALNSRRRATVMSDRFEIAAELYYHGLQSLIFGSAPQVAQWQRWNDARNTVPRSALVITFSSANADTARRLQASYSKLSRGPVLQYRFGGTVERFSTAWAAQPRTGAASTLFGR